MSSYVKTWMNVEGMSKAEKQAVVDMFCRLYDAEYNYGMSFGELREAGTVSVFYDSLDERLYVLHHRDGFDFCNQSKTVKEFDYSLGRLQR